MTEINEEDYVWVPIVGLEDTGYRICEEGYILSTKGKVMKTQMKNGRIKLTLCYNGKKTQYRVDVLMANTFLDNPNNFKYIKYKDGDPNNLNKNNIIWSDNKAKVEDPHDEIWKPVIGFPRYQINPKGVRNAIDHEILITGLSSDGYPTVSLYTENINVSSTKSVHKLMALHYISNPQPDIFTDVNHKNGIKTDFRIENLEWVTHKRNVEHAVEMGLRKNGDSSSKGIELLDDDFNVIKIFTSSVEAGKYIGYSGPLIRKHMHQTEPTNIKGFILRYKSQEDLEGEIWKKVNTIYPNINDKYKVSNYGRVKGKNKILKPYVTPKNYAKVKLSNYSESEHGKKDKSIKNAQIKNLYVFNLVAYAFLEFEGDINLYQVNHKDKNIHNDRLDNLEILIVRDHSIKDRGKSVLCVKDDIYYIFKSQSKTSELLGLKTQNVHNAIKNGNKHFGYLFYHFDSEKAQEIVSNFKERGINPSEILI
jgi:hypothetical protein